MTTPTDYLLFGYSRPQNYLTMTAPDEMESVGVVKASSPEQRFQSQLAPTDLQIYATTNYELKLPD